MPPIISFTWRGFLSDSSYPEGNFGVNQLLDGSMGLSPLYSALTSDLHVNTATILHRTFVRLQSIQAQFTIFRVPTYTLQLKSLSRQNQDRPLVHPCGFPDLPFSTRYGFNTLTLAHMLDSLVRVSRRVEYDNLIRIALQSPSLDGSWRRRINPKTSPTVHSSPDIGFSTTRLTQQDQSSSQEPDQKPLVADLATF